MGNFDLWVWDALLFVRIGRGLWLGINENLHIILHYVWLYRINIDNQNILLLIWIQIYEHLYIIILYQIKSQILKNSNNNIK